MPPPRRKRSRSTNNHANTNNNQEQRRQRRRPDPPPPAPPALIRLLKKDPKVLNYFKALQTNLVYDVEKWKTRANDYKTQLEEYESFRNTTSTTTNNTNVVANDDENKLIPVTNPGTKTNNDTIEDAEFDLSSSEEEGENDENESGGGQGTGGNRDEKARVATKETTINGKKPSYPFHFEDSDDDDDDDEYNVHNGDATDKKQYRTHPGETTKTSGANQSPIYVLRPREPTTKRVEVVIPTRILVGWKILRTAETYFRRLGIVLATKVVVEDTTVEQETHAGTATIADPGNGDSTHTSDEQPPTLVDSHVSYIRRSDDVVLHDILCRIKEWTRLKTTTTVKNDHDGTTNKPTKQQYAAFSSVDALPCFVSNQETTTTLLLQHAAVQGMELLSKALSWIDAFGPILDELEQDRHEHNDNSGDDDSYLSQLLLRTDDDDALLFYVGMKHRHNMVREFRSSLEGEICDTWPTQDRFQRTTNTALHYNQNNNKERQSPQDREDAKDGIATTRRKLVLDSKNALRLATMADRCVLARIVAGIHLHRSDPSSAANFLWRYLLSTVPSFLVEDHPNHPPVLSLLLVETILDTHFDTNRPFSEYLAVLHPFLLLAFRLSLSITASIYRTRLGHDDTRISEPALVEETAFQRIQKRFHGTDGWTIHTSNTQDRERLVEQFLQEFTNAMETVDVSSSSLQKQQQQQQQHRTTSMESAIMMVWMLPTTLILYETDDGVRQLFGEWSKKFLALPTTSRSYLFVVEAAANAVRQMEIRNLEKYRSIAASPITTEANTIVRSILSEFCKSITAEHMTTTSNVSILLGICQNLADGETALLLIHAWMQQSQTTQSKHCFADHHYFSNMPIVRVINLERRRDRMASFVSQAMHSGLCAIRGVIPPERWQSIGNPRHNDTAHEGKGCKDLLSSIGTHALDGSVGSPARVEKTTLEWFRSGGITDETAKRELDSTVKPQWRPNDIRAFDVNAPDDPNVVVSLSPSERACALSHIATWHGVVSSSNATFTGFAIGDPMHSGKDTIVHPPCPAALVLEDDAILVDRFRERLDQLLEELPRDFHYCALGYAKPKEAPLVDIPGCEHIKLPTMTWYLTGYLLSEAGARYLLNRLPVEGPIDAWMGRKMILGSNWENEFGYRMGVGDAPQVGTDSKPPTALTKEEIRVCVQFRAYCASIPLCDQTVRTAAATGASAVNHPSKPNPNWRFRDSDIVYSGHVGTIRGRTTKKRKHPFHSS